MVEDILKVLSSENLTWLLSIHKFLLTANTVDLQNLFLLNVNVHSTIFSYWKCQRIYLDINYTIT